MTLFDFSDDLIVATVDSPVLFSISLAENQAGQSPPNNKIASQKGKVSTLKIGQARLRD